MITLFAVAAFADDIDIDIDLGGPEETPITYNGGFTTRSADKVPTNAPIKVSSSTGTTTVYCTDTEYIETRVDYILSGPEGPPLESYGKSIKLSATGGTTGNVALIGGTRPAAVKNATVTLVVNVPKEAKLTVSANGDWLKVVGCDGSVTGTAKTSAYVGGHLDAFTVTANGGNATVEVEGDGKLTGNSAISAPKGEIALTLPMTQDLKIDARGSAVSVAHVVAGTVDSTVVSGTIGTPGPTLTLKASGAVTVKTP